MVKLLSDRQTWQMEDPFVFDQVDQAFLDENPLTDKIKWSNKIFKPIRDKIRDYYYGKQNGTCVYCRMPIDGGTDNIEIEHIVDKNNREDFTFESLNLIVSCHNCNFTKKKTKVLHNCPPLNQYPENKDEFKIIHGHLDNYFSNIVFKQNSIYHAISDKGEFTIKKCGLTRTRLAEQREETEMYQDDPIVADVINFRKNPSAENLELIIKKLREMTDQK